MTSRLGTGKSLTFFYSVQPLVGSGGQQPAAGGETEQTGSGRGQGLQAGNRACSEPVFIKPICSKKLTLKLIRFQGYS